MKVLTTLDRFPTIWRKSIKKPNTTVEPIFRDVSILSGVSTTVSLGTALTEIGLVASIRLGSIASPCGVVSIVSASVSKKLRTKVSKHEKLFSLASSKGDNVNSLVLKALNDSKVTDDELYLIVNQMIQYRPLTSKEEIRKKIRKLRTKVVKQPVVEQPDLEKIRQEIREKVRKRLPKKKKKNHRPARLPKVFLLRFLSRSFLFCSVIFLRFRHQSSPNL